MKSRIAFGAMLISALLLLAGQGCGGNNTGTVGNNADAASLIGVWCARAVDPAFNVPYSVELILGTDGIQFQEQYVYQTGTVTSIFGNFRVFRDPKNTPTLRLDTAGGTPIVDQAGSPIRYPAETYCYNLVNQNSLTLVIAAVVCPGGPDTCVVTCCNPQIQQCAVLQHTRGSCNAPG